MGESVIPARAREEELYARLGIDPYGMLHNLPFISPSRRFNTNKTSRLFVFAPVLQN
jgi:hypothetical protein